MPRTKFRKGFAKHPIVVQNRMDCFGGHEYGMITQMVLAREIRWPKDPIKGMKFLLHKVPGFHRQWTVTHANSGLDILGYGNWGDSEEEAKQLTAERLNGMAEAINWLLPKNHLYGPAVELQMIALSRKNNQPWGNKDLDPQTYIQKPFISEQNLERVNNEMNYLRRRK